MGRIFREACLMVAIGLGAGLIANTVRPAGLPLGSDPRSIKVGSNVRLLSLDEARLAFEEGATFIDTRPRATFIRGHVEGAVSLPPENLEAAYREWWEFIPRETMVVVYAGDREPRLAGARAEWLMTMGHQEVVILYDGWEAWERAGLPQATGGE